VKPKKIAELAGPYAWGGSVNWSADGEKVIVDTAMERYKPIWDIISIDTVHMLQKPQSDMEGNLRYIYDPIWSPDRTRFLADAFYDADTTEIQSLILGDLSEKPFQFLDSWTFKRTKKDLAYTGMLNRLMAQPWSPDGKSAIVWRAEYISDSTSPIYKLYYYLFDEGTSKIVYQTKDKVGSAFWTKDSTILYLTHTETKISRGQKHKRYTLWQIKLNKRDKGLATKPGKIYTDSEPWYSYRYSPTGRFLMIVMDTTTTSSWVYNILDIQNRYKFTIANIEKLTEGNRLAWAWHPKENKAMYSIGNLDKSDIYELDLVSRKSRKVYTEKGLAWSLTYSGTGNRIAYYVGKMGHLTDAIVSIKTDGTDWKLVSPSVQSANFYLQDPTFAWKPNGDTLAFLLVPWTARDIWKLGVYTATFK
jgi:Tol biopolymer transport system component